MLTKPTISMGLKDLTNAEILAFSQTVGSSMTGNSRYSSPVPSLILLGTTISNYNDALTAYGSTGTRGSHLQKLQVDSTRAALEEALTALANYCMNTTPNDAEAFTSGGFPSKRESIPVGSLPAVRNLKQMTGIDIPFNAVKLKWKRPLDVAANNVKVYNVYRNTTAIFGTATFLGSTSKASFLDSGLTAAYYYYWIIPVGSAGAGVVSDVCLANVSLQPS